MPHRLKKLVITRCDLVDEGANPGARILLAKRKDAAPPSPPEPESLDARWDAYTKQYGEVKDMDKRDRGSQSRQDYEREVILPAVKALMDADPSLTQPLAYATLMQRRPELYSQYVSLPAVEDNSPSPAYQSPGHSTESADRASGLGKAAADAEEQLDKLARSLVSKGIGTRYAEAYVTALESPDGRRLYEVITSAETEHSRRVEANYS